MESAGSGEMGGYGVLSLTRKKAHGKRNENGFWGLENIERRRQHN